MSSIRQNTSSSTLSTSSTNSHSSSISCSSNTSYSNAAHPASEHTPQHPSPVHYRSSTSKSAEKDTAVSNPSSSPSPPPSPHHHHNPTHSEPLIHPVAAKSSANHNIKAPRGCMSHFDFTYSGLYVSGSQYGRKTLGTGTGAGGSGECGIM